MVNVPNSRRLKIIATYASAKLTGLRARGCGSLTTLRSTHTQNNINGEERSYPVYPTSTCGQVFLLDLMPWQGFARKSSLPSQGFLCKKIGETSIHTLTLPLYLCSLKSKELWLGLDEKFLRSIHNNIFRI